MLRFQASEIVDMAVRIERNGYAFYSGILEKTSDAKLRGIFDDLAKQEMHHIDDFRRLLEGVKRYEPAEEYVGEHQDYLGALADAHVFVNEGVGARVAEETKDAAAALEAAMSFERDSVLFFYEIRDMVGAEDKKVVEEVIRQEKMHLVRLNGIKHGLGGK